MSGPAITGRTGKALASRPASSAVAVSQQQQVGRLVASLPDLDKARLLLLWRNYLGGTAPAHLPTWLFARLLALRLQNQAFGDVSAETLRRAKRASGSVHSQSSPILFAKRTPATRDGVDLKPGALLAREWKGKLERVTVLEDGFAWNGKTYRSLSQVAKAMTGASWNGHRFFGLRSGALRPVSKGDAGVIGAKTSKHARPTAEAAP